MNADEKLQELTLLLIKQRKNLLDLVKQYLVQYNPDPELMPEIKMIIESNIVLFENEAFDFLDKWAEYKKCLHKSIRIQQEESMKTNFESLMTKNFPGGLK